MVRIQALCLELRRLGVGDTNLAAHKGLLNKGSCLCLGPLWASKLVWGSRSNSSPKSLKISQQAIILHTFGVQVGLVGFGVIQGCGYGATGGLGIGRGFRYVI